MNIPKERINWWSSANVKRKNFVKAFRTQWVETTGCPGSFINWIYS